MSPPLRTTRGGSLVGVLRGQGTWGDAVLGIASLTVCASACTGRHGGAALPDGEGVPEVGAQQDVSQLQAARPAQGAAPFLAQPLSHYHFNIKDLLDASRFRTAP